jgi:type II secretory pathway pseudopilin PulG
MMKPLPTRRQPQPSEEGYILIWVIFLLVIFTLALSVAVPRMSKEIQRDREVETMERGKQYIRAVQLYYRKFHAYPPNVDALVKTTEIRFLRKKYIDPMTGKDDWKPILFGQAKTQTLGFFGQPLAGAGSAGGSVMAGTGPSGGNGINGSSTLSSGGSPSSGSSGSMFSTTDSGTDSGTAAATTGSSTDPSGGSSGSVGGAGSTGATGSGSGGGSSTSSTGLSGQTFGGAGIIGFSPASSKQSILIYKKKNHYNQWEFIYDPLSEMVTQSGNTGNIGQPASSTTTPIGAPSSSPSTSTPTTPASPQQ